MREISRSIHAGTDAGITPFRDRVPIRRRQEPPIHNREPGEMIASSVHGNMRLPLMAIIAGLVLSLPAGAVHAADRTAILAYICTTYESARQVALEQGWKHPESMPGDCRTLFRRGFEERFAEVSEVIEVLPVGGGRWAEIGKVRRNMVETGYSAGISVPLLLF
jgi:hypothetical protein